MTQLPRTLSRSKKKKKPADSQMNRGGFSLFGVPEKSVYEFTRNLSVMIRARIPLVDALDVVRGQLSHRRFRETVDKLIRDVKAGKSFAKALGKYPGIFDSLYIHLVETGEAAGILGEVLEKLAEYLEKRSSLKQKVRKALAYPVFILGITVLVLIFLLTVIVPTFAEMYADYNAELPASTAFIITFSSILTDYFLWFLFACTGLAVFIHRGLAQPAGARVRDYVILHIPLLGSFYRKGHNTQFCQTLGTLLKNGIGLVNALDITKKSCPNIYVKEAIKEMAGSVKQGKSLAGSATKTGLFPPVITRMITVGEETAELNSMLLHIAESNRQEMDADLEMLASVLEPALIVIIGIVIGIVIVAMYLPVFELMNVIQ